MVLLWYFHTYIKFTFIFTPHYLLLILSGSTGPFPLICASSISYHYIKSYVLDYVQMSFIRNAYSILAKGLFAET